MAAKGPNSAPSTKRCPPSRHRAPDRSNTGEFCSQHAKAGMVDVKTRCAHQGYTKQPPNSVDNGSRKATFCSTHQGWNGERVSKLHSSATRGVQKKKIETSSTPEQSQNATPSDHQNTSRAKYFKGRAAGGASTAAGEGALATLTYPALVHGLLR